MIGVDLSYSRLSLTALENLRRKGAGVIGQCLWTAAEQPAPRIENLRLAVNEGWPVFGYISINARQEGDWHVGKGCSGVPDDLWNKLRFIAVDVELPGIQVTDIIKAVSEVRALGKIAIIYTSSNVWHNYINPSNSTMAAVNYHVPLWYANWNGRAAIDPAEITYGGWDRITTVGKQYTGGTQVGTWPNAIDVDFNIFDDPFIHGQEDQMTPEERAALNALVAKVARDEKLTVVGALYNIRSLCAIAGVAVPAEVTRKIAYIEAMSNG